MITKELTDYYGLSANQRKKINTTLKTLINTSLKEDGYHFNEDDISEEIFNKLEIQKPFDTFQKFVTSYKKAVHDKKVKQEQEEAKKHKRKEDENRRLEARRLAILRQEELLEQTLRPFNEKTKELLSNIWFKPNKYVIHVGPTNSGKTYNAIQTLKQAGKGIYLAPLRLLALEIYERLKSELNIELRTGEETILSPSNTHSSRTVEMMDYSTHYDVVVIDECFMLSDKQRGKSWLKAILESDAEEIHIISSLESLSIIEKILSRTNKTYEINSYERKVPLVFETKPYPNIRKPLDKTIFVTFSRIDCLRFKIELEDRGIGCSVLYGNLPPDVKKEQMRLFSEGINKIAVSTDVIGMGLNMPCDHICFLQTSKFDGITHRSLNSTEVKQIGGRAGRYGLSEKGKVWTVDGGKMIPTLGTENNHDISRTYCSINIDILIELPGKDFLEKLTNYEKMKFIPDVLDGIIFLEDTQQYKELYEENEKLINFPLNVTWEFVTLPVKKNIMHIFNMLINSYHKKNLEQCHHLVGRNYTKCELEQLETISGEIDLLIAFNNKRVFKNLLNQEYIAQLVKDKYDIIELINKFLLDKKKLKVKKCTSCGKNVGINWQHKECQECYENRMFYRGNEYDEWYDDDGEDEED